MSRKTGSCAECKYHEVVIAPGTPRQIIARYKAAWDACYSCFRRAIELLDEWDCCMLDIREQGWRLKNHCPSCDKTMQSLCRRTYALCHPHAKRKVAK